MRINSIDSTTFGVNLNSPKLSYSKQDFFVKIQGYGKNPLWAYKVKKTADNAVKLIRYDIAAEYVLQYVASGISKANKFCFELYKRSCSGLLRTFRVGWKVDKEPGYGLATGYGSEKSRYRGYKNRLDSVYEKPLINPYIDIGLTRPKRNSILDHGKAEYINNSLDYVFELSKNIFPKFIHQEVQPEDMKGINKTIAEIRWVLAHSTPWTRGSDAISNVYIRAMYKAIGVKTYPLKEGVSLDLEAYCTQLSDYKGKFATYFEKPPEIVE